LVSRSVLKFPKMKRYRVVEPRWVAEYCTEFYPKDIVLYRCPLGMPPKEVRFGVSLKKALQLYYPYRPKVDALIVTPTAIILVEAKVWKYIDGLSKLPVYAALVKQTPELEKYLPRPVIKRLLVPIIPQWLLPIAKELNVEIINWAPDWVKEVYLERERYYTPEGEAERARRKEILEKLGFF